MKEGSQTMDSLISVIIPVYNVEQWLDECIESVVNQSYTNLEIILIDDGSPDNCPKMCEQWAQRDERIHVIHKKNGGLSDARNAGLDICTGDYISFVDSDDHIHKDMYQIMLQDMLETGSDIVRCSKYFQKDTEEIEDQYIDSARYYNQKQMLDCYFYHKDNFCGGIWDKLFKAEIFKNLRFPVGINSEDYYVYATIYNTVDKLYYNNIPLYYYRIRENSICSAKDINNHSFDKIKVADIVKQFIDKNYPARSYDALAFQIICRYANYYNILMDKGYSMRKEWKQDMRKFTKKMLFHKKIEISFKIKYLFLTYFSSVYRIKVH